MTTAADPPSGRVPAVQELLLGLTGRVRPNLRWSRARVRLDLGDEGTWGLVLEGGVAAVTAVPIERPDVWIRTTVRVLGDMYTARKAGYEAFLDGDVEVRGNLSLALELDSMFEPLAPAPESWPRTAHVTAGKVRWSILEAGPPDALPVLLLHGLGSTKASFLTSVRALSDRYRVLACDAPGFGDSSKPVAAYDAPWFAARVVELLDALDVKRAGIIGNSMGGRIGLEVGFRYPERVKALVLYCPALAFLRFRRAVPIVRLLRPELALVPVRPRRSTILMVMRSIMAHPERIPASWFEAAADEYFRVYADPRGRLAFYAAARHVYLDEPHGERGFWARLAKLDVPVQFVFGRHDPLIPAAFARRVGDALPGAEVTVLEDCGHVPQLEQPDQVHALARSMLA